jgi:hypothetical protein
MMTGKTRGIVVCDVGAGIVCFAPDGERLWEYALKPPVTAYPAVGDVDGDGTEEVVACGGQGTVAVLDAAGRLKWTAHTPGSVGAESCPSVADLDGDGKQKIPADRHVEFRRAVSVPTLRSERVADALPLLDQGRLLTVASMESDDWALYPYDEPSSPYAKTTLNLVEVARLVRQADPNILIYTDPTSGTTMETVKMLTGLIDIWCPSDELLDRFGDELVPDKGKSNPPPFVGIMSHGPSGDIWLRDYAREAVFSSSTAWACRVKWPRRSWVPDAARIIPGQAASRSCASSIGRSSAPGPFRNRSW